VEVPEQFHGIPVVCPQCQFSFPAVAQEPPAPIQVAEAIASSPVFVPEVPVALEPPPASASEVPVALEPPPVLAPDVPLALDMPPARRPERTSALPWFAGAVACILLVFTACAGITGLGLWSMRPPAVADAKGSRFVAGSEKGNKATEAVRPELKVPEDEPHSVPVPPASEPKTNEPETPQKPKPVDPADPLSIPLVTLWGLKEATVLIKVEAGAASASSAGFLMRVEGETGYIATNEHLVVPSAANVKPGLTLVFSSGTDKERSVKAELVAVDSERDLAMLKVQGVKELPKAIEFADTANLVGTAPVYAFGFPAASSAQGRPAISIGKGTVTAIRKDERGRRVLVQIDGGIHPGNSGGPVVDSAGRLIGVATANLRQSGVNAAIPQDDLRDMLAGRIGTVGVYRKVRKPGGNDLVGELWTFDSRNRIDKSVASTLSLPGGGAAERSGTADIVVQAQLIDPLVRLRRVQTFYAPASGRSPPSPQADGTWAALPESKKEKSAIADGKVQLSLTLPEAKGEYYFQFSYEGPDGKPTFTQPRAFRLDRGTEPLVRDAAMLEAVRREPVPSKEALAKAEKTIREQYKDDFAKKKPADMLEVALKLQRHGAQVSDDPPRRFAFFQEGLTLAAASGDFLQALRIAEELATDFEVSMAELTAIIVEKATPNVRARDAGKSLAEESLGRVSEALAADDFDTADRLIKGGSIVAAKAQANSVMSAFTLRGKEVERLRKEFVQFLAAQTVLENDAKDAAASLTVGRHLCFVKGDWDKGLPLLIQGDDAALKSLAEKDTAGPETPNAQFELANAWHELAQRQETEVAKARLQGRALLWYQQALPGLVGINKSLAEKRLAEADKVPDRYRERVELFAFIRQGIKEKRTAQTAIQGFPLAKEFRQLPAEGAVLIGFDVTLGKFLDSDTIASLRPIYATARGEQRGELLGQAQARVLTVKAKPGYAVGALNLKTGLGIDGFSVTFMKFDKTRLKKDDSYTSDWIGNKDSSGQVTVGDGSLVIGVCGRRNDAGAAVALGLVVIGKGK
jgi:S1-C subfamily serine protease